MLKDALSPAGKNEGHAKAVMIFAFIEQLLRAPHSLTECSSLRIHLRLAGVRPGLPASLCIRCNGSETTQGRPLGRLPLWPSRRRPSAFCDAPAPPSNRERKKATWRVPASPHSLASFWTVPTASLVLAGCLGSTLLRERWVWAATATQDLG